MTAPIKVEVTLDDRDLQAAAERAVQAAIESQRSLWRSNGYFEGLADERANNEITFHVAAKFARLVLDDTDPQDRAHGLAQDMLNHLASGVVPNWAL